mmetsp:Transcript_14131/g.56329  ORF Transcript_14131/g.56329 Transcript_14131/m.56329 type:complete len:201 (-) Transcript_14131:322-924(-)
MARSSQLRWRSTWRRIATRTAESSALYAARSSRASTAIFVRTSEYAPFHQTRHHRWYAYGEAVDDDDPPAASRRRLRRRRLCFRNDDPASSASRRLTRRGARPTIWRRPARAHASSMASSVAHATNTSSSIDSTASCAGRSSGLNRLFSESSACTSTCRVLLPVIFSSTTSCSSATSQAGGARATSDQTTAMSPTASHGA